MAQMNRRQARRQRHSQKRRGGEPRQFATEGEERASIRKPDASRNPEKLSDFDPAYGHTHSAQAQPKGGQAPNERESYGNRRGSDDAGAIEAGHGGGESGFGKTYGQGFGVGAGRGVESSSTGLEGGPRERDYRGNAGTTFGAVVGPDALKEDTAEDNRRRPDPKPEEEGS